MLKLDSQKMILKSTSQHQLILNLTFPVPISDKEKKLTFEAPQKNVKIKIN